MVQLGINTCFAVKRWPRPADWAPIVRDTFGLDLVQVTLDMVDLARDDDALARDVDAHLEAADRHGLTIHSVFTGIAGYYMTSCSTPCTWPGYARASSRTASRPSRT